MSSGISDMHLIDQAEIVLREIGCYDKIITILDNLHKKFPQDEKFA